jgi:hypothetical protein
MDVDKWRAVLEWADGSKSIVAHHHPYPYLSDEIKPFVRWFRETQFVHAPRGNMAAILCKYSDEKLCELHAQYLVERE